MSRALAIVGTAKSWRETPWGESSLTITSLNDAYLLGLPRWDCWFEQHPLNRFVFRKRTAGHLPVSAGDIPPGYYLRPEGHLEWLAAQATRGPLWLQESPPAGWTHAARYPREAIEAQFADVLFMDPSWPIPYVASGPSWMLLWALREGYDDIGIYGIHLATEREYVEQRPNFEGLLMYAIAKGVRIRLPPTTPLCKSRHAYCYEMRPDAAQDGPRTRLFALNDRRAALVQQVLSSPWWRRRGPALREIEAIDIEKIEVKQLLQRLQIAAAFASPEWRAVQNGDGHVLAH